MKVQLLTIQNIDGTIQSSLGQLDRIDIKVWHQIKVQLITIQNIDGTILSSLDIF
jgi:hypothetical protein